MQWAFIVGRITSLGGTIPAYVPVLSGDTPKSAQKPKSSIAPPQQSTAEVESSGTPMVLLPVPADPAKYEFLNSRLEMAVNKGKSADKYFDEMNASLNSKGEIIHPRIAETHARMHHALDSARRELEKGDLAEASTYINIAIEYARRLMNDLGH